jgi:hypothetical protein
MCDRLHTHSADATHTSAVVVLEVEKGALWIDELQLRKVREFRVNTERADYKRPAAKRWMKPVTLSGRQL